MFAILDQNIIFWSMSTGSPLELPNKNLGSSTVPLTNLAAETHIKFCYVQARPLEWLHVYQADVKAEC